MKLLYDREGRKTVEVAEFVVVGNNVTFGSNVKVMPFSIVGDNSTIGNNVVIDSYVQVPAGSNITNDTIVSKYEVSFSLPAKRKGKKAKQPNVLEQILKGGTK